MPCVHHGEGGKQNTDHSISELSCLPLLSGQASEQEEPCAQALPDALQALEDAVLSCDADVAVEACSSIQQVLAGSDDYTRKILLVRWYMQLAAACSLGHKSPSSERS